MKNRNCNGLKNNFYRLSIISLVFISASFTYSCASSETADSKDVNQSKIHQNYTITYDASNPNSYIAVAQFRFGGSKGTTLRLSEPSKVFVNGTEMKQESDVISGTFYKLSLTNTSEFSFKFTDTEKKEYNNSTKLIPISMKTIDEINGDIKNTIYWEGQPIASNETVTVEIQDNEGNRAQATASVVGSDNVVISPEDMKTLVPGKAQVSVTRSTNTVLKEVTEDGGNFYTQYISEKISVDLKKTVVAEPK